MASFTSLIPGRADVAEAVGNCGAPPVAVFVGCATLNHPRVNLAARRCRGGGDVAGRGLDATATTLGAAVPRACEGAVLRLGQHALQALSLLQRSPLGVDRGQTRGHSSGVDHHRPLVAIPARLHSIGGWGGAGGDRRKVLCLAALLADLPESPYGLQQFLRCVRVCVNVCDTNTYTSTPSCPLTQPSAWCPTATG